MSIHINAKNNEIAETVLMPGDPLRAKYIAENLLYNVVCYNKIRNMYGFTGFYNGKRVSIQSSGMGAPSISIYVNELINSYSVKNIIRIGTCGSIQESINVKDIIIAMSASTDSSFNNLRFKGMNYAPTADWQLLLNSYKAAKKLGLNFNIGSVLSTDTFYNDDPNEKFLWAKFGILAVEMEVAALYTLAAKFEIKALAILTVSDSLITEEFASADERQNSFIKMVEIALEII